MNIAIYSRKSKYSDKGESTHNQIDLCREYAEKHFSVDSFIIYEDEGFSGGHADRPEFQRMLKDAKARKFNILICYRLDRISRNISDFASLVELMQEYDIGFISIREQFDTSTPMGRAMMYIASVFAQLERETIAERIRDNMLQLARTGRWLGGKTPIGFKSEPVIYTDKNQNRKKMFVLVAIPEELATVETIFSKFLQLGTLTQLESWCLENNIKSRNDNFFDKSALRVILSNPVYVVADDVFYEYCESHNMDIASSRDEFNGEHGVIVYNKNIERKGRRNRPRDKSEWVVAVSRHKGIIQSVDWVRVQNMLEENSENAPRAGTSSVSLLTTLLRCKSCGSRFRVSYGRERDGGVRHYYYKCILKERSRGSHCSIKNITGSVADQIVIDELKSLSASGSDFMRRLTRKRDRILVQTKDQQREKEQLEKELRECSRAISNLTSQLAQNQSSAAAKYIIKQIEDTDLRIRDIKLKLDRLSSEKEASLIEQKNIEMVQHLLRSFAQTVDELDFEDKKKLLKSIVKEIIWDGETLELNIYGINRKRTL